MGNADSVMGASGAVATSIFDFEVESIDNKVVSLSQYKGKRAYLVVNVARFERGLEILAFPCNDFLSQEPGTNEEVLAYVQSKNVTFPVLGKLACERGSASHPLYCYLKNTVGGGILGKQLKWNFTKFLCDANGVPVKRAGPTDSPLTMEKDIVALLEAN